MVPLIGRWPLVVLNLGAEDISIAVSSLPIGGTEEFLKASQIS